MNTQNILIKHLRARGRYKSREAENEEYSDRNIIRAAKAALEGKRLTMRDLSAEDQTQK